MEYVVFGCSVSVKRMVTRRPVAVTRGCEADVGDTTTLVKASLMFTYSSKSRCICRPDTLVAPGAGLA